MNFLSPAYFCVDLICHSKTDWSTHGNGERLEVELLTCEDNTALSKSAPCMKLMPPVFHIDVQAQPPLICGSGDFFLNRQKLMRMQI